MYNSDQFGGLSTENYIILIVYGCLFAVFALFGLVSYLFKGFGMYRIAKNLKISGAWMAFIPIASNFLQGELAGEINVGKKHIKNPGVWTLVYPMLYSTFVVIIYLVLLFSLFFPILSNIDDLNNNEFSVSMFIPAIILYVVFIIAIIIGQAIQYVIYGLVRYKTNQRYMDDGKAVVHMLFGLFIPLYQSIFYFKLRKRMPIGFETPLTPAIEPPAEATE